MVEQKDNIVFVVDSEYEDVMDTVDIQQLLNTFDFTSKVQYKEEEQDEDDKSLHDKDEDDKSVDEKDEDLLLSQMIYYHENFTIKDLLLICDYYDITKELKKKYTKDVIVHFLVDFESNPENNTVVIQRKNMWFYMEQLKNDKFMKKFVLW
jgi:hypothetical protein